MLDFQSQWQSAIGGLKATFAEQVLRLQRFEEQIQKLGEEQKVKTLWDCLELLGSNVCFTAAALIPGAGLLGASAGVGLLSKSIRDLVNAHQVRSTSAPGFTVVTQYIYEMT